MGEGSENANFKVRNGTSHSVTLLCAAGGGGLCTVLWVIVVQATVAKNVASSALRCARLPAAARDKRYKPARLQTNLDSILAINCACI